MVSLLVASVTAPLITPLCPVSDRKHTIKTTDVNKPFILFTFFNVKLNKNSWFSLDNGKCLSNLA